MAPAKLKIEPEISTAKLELETVKQQQGKSGSKVALALLGLAIAMTAIGIVPAAAVSFSTAWSVPLFAIGLGSAAVSAIGAAIFKYFYGGQQKPNPK